MRNKRSGIIRPTEFGCQTPIRFYEHCVSCPRFVECPDLALISQVLRMDKAVNYRRDFYSDRGMIEGARHSVDAKEFNCLAPLSFFEHSRKNCGRKGRCREEGLLLALLTGKKRLDYTEDSADDSSEHDASAF
jgi:hypothetical protein